MGEQRALIVEDSRTASAFLAKALKKYNIEADFLNNCPDAFDYLRRSRPCVIFMDQTLPGLTGIEAIKQLKASPFTRTIPVIMYTGSNDQHLLQEARAAGAEGVLSKKLELKQVERLLRQTNLIAPEWSVTDLSTTRRPQAAKPSLNGRPAIREQSPAAVTSTASSRKTEASQSPLSISETTPDTLPEPLHETTLAPVTEATSLAVETAAPALQKFDQVDQAQQAAEAHQGDLNHLLDRKLAEFNSKILQPFLSEFQTSSQFVYADEQYRMLDKLIDTKFKDLCQTTLQPFIAEKVESEFQKLERRLEQREKARQVQLISELKLCIDSLQTRKDNPLNNLPDDIETALTEAPIKYVKYKSASVMVGVMVFAVTLVGFFQWM